MMGFNFFGSMNKLNLIGRDKSNSKNQKTKDQNVSIAINQAAGETSDVNKVSMSEQNKGTVQETSNKEIVQSSGQGKERSDLKTQEEGSGTVEGVAGVSKPDVYDTSNKSDEEFDNDPSNSANNKTDQKNAEDLVINNQNKTDSELGDEESESRDKFEMHNTTFYRVLTKSFYDRNLNILKPFQKKDEDTALKSSTKRTKKTTRSLRERKLVISSPQNFQRVENEMTLLLRKEAENMGLGGTLKKSASLDDLLRDSGDFSNRFGALDKGKVEFSSAGDLSVGDSIKEPVEKLSDGVKNEDRNDENIIMNRIEANTICLTCGWDHHSIPEQCSEDEIIGGNTRVESKVFVKNKCMDNIKICLTCGGDHSIPVLLSEGEQKSVDLEVLIKIGEGEYSNSSVEDVITSSEEDIDRVVDEYMSNLGLMRNMTQSTPELLKSINQIPKERFEKPPENKFPLVDDNVEIRRNQSIQRNRVSKTTDFDLGWRRQDSPINPKNFDIPGIVKFQLPNNNTIITKLNQEYVSYENENFYRVTKKTKSKVPLAHNIVIKSARYLNSRSKESKEVELKDTQNLSYILYFDSIKTAKQFMDNEKIQVYVTDNKVTIKKTLLRFLGKRSSREILEKKGIYKNEPIFGNTLRDIYVKNLASGSVVPVFVCRVIELIERVENIKSLGLYRTSGNLATIQKIRFEVDNGRLEILDQFCKDPDVLTGSLKLFFRELKEPLISCDVCEKLVEVTKLDPKQISSKEHQKIKTTMMKNMHEANLETFYVVMRHLLNVVKYKEFNKMDAYNLSVCWGPSMIFSVHGASTNATFESKDIVTQSHDATRLVDFLLSYYEVYPSELDALSKKPESVTEKILALKRQESRDSVASSDSSKSQKKSSSNLSLSVDEITKKLVEIIEPNLSIEGLYKKPGSPDKTNKLMKKLTKKKINELDKHKTEIHEMTDALKRYLREQEGLVSKEIIDWVLRATSGTDNSQNYLEPLTRRKVTSLIEETPKKDTLIYILRHLAKVIDHQTRHKVSKSDIIGIWTDVLDYQWKCQVSYADFSQFLTVAVEVFNDNLPDIVRSSVNNNGGSPNRNNIMGEVVKQMKNQQERDRNSRYDNVDCDVSGEASVLEDKTEQTKL